MLYNGLRLFILIQCIFSLLIALHLLISTDDEMSYHNYSFIYIPFWYRNIQQRQQQAQQQQSQQQQQQKVLSSSYKGRNPNPRDLVMKQSYSSGMDQSSLSSSLTTQSKIIHTRFCMTDDEDVNQNDKEQESQEKEHNNNDLFTLDNYCSRPHFDYNASSMTATTKESIRVNNGEPKTIQKKTQKPRKTKQTKLVRLRKQN
jgi:hypothetical protein